MIANACFVVAVIGSSTLVRFCLIRENKKFAATENVVDPAPIELELDDNGEKKSVGVHV